MLGYDPAGNLVTTTLPASNGYTETRTWDAADRLTKVANTNSTGTLSAFTSTRDPVGNPTLIATTRGSGTTNESFQYDAADRLIKDCLHKINCINAGTSITYS